MTIAIPAILDTQIAALRASIEPVLDAATNIASSPHPPMVNANRYADLLDLLCELVDSGTLTVEGIHKVADSTNPATSADATDLSEAQTLLNEIKGDYNAHIVLVGSNEHVGADVTNDVTSANATDQATAETLANEIKTDLNAHRALAAATGHYVADPDNAVTAADASDLATLLTLTNEIKAQYNSHIATINGASATTVNDRTAFSPAGSLANTTITFADNTTTVALRGIARTVVSHTTSVLTLPTIDPLPAVPVEGDTFVLSFSIADAEIAALRQERTISGSGPNPYGSGPAIANSALKILEQLGQVRQTIDTGTTDGAGTNVQLVDSGGGFTIGAHNELWVHADDSGTLDVDNLRRVTTNTATEINVRNAFWNAAGSPTVPGASTVYGVRAGQIYSATAAAGAATSLTFPATISFALNELIGVQIAITGGTGIGQRRIISANTAGVSSVVTVPTWDVTPDGTSTFELRFDTMPAYLVTDQAASASRSWIFLTQGLDLVS
jgi:hypothetical protein